MGCQQLSAGEYNALVNRLELLTGQVVSNKDLLTAGSSLREYELYKQVLRSFQQSFLALSYFQARHGSYVHDRFMAENALWLGECFGADSKVALWAHNNHISINPSYLGSGYNGNPDAYYGL
ncbi:MAG: erythromycin esterase family protein, partial [bacterium]|nr:erythromycin esterase family protein [bacterium]